MRFPSLLALLCAGSLAAASGCGEDTEQGPRDQDSFRPGNTGGSSGRDAGTGGAAGTSAVGGSGASGTGGSVPLPDGALPDANGGTAGCRHLTFRDDAYAFELVIVNSSEFYKVDFPPSLMHHCVAQ